MRSDHPTRTADVLTRAIPSTGETIPVIGLGTWQTFDVGRSAADRKPPSEVLSSFTDLGGTLVDSSPMYRRAEEVVCDLADSLGLSDRLFVATKVWTTGRAKGIAQMEDSMRKLRASRVDLMQVHNLVDVETHLDTLAAWKREGRVRYVGVTHYAASSHAEVARVIAAHPVDFLQINYSVGEPEAEPRLLPLAAERGIAVIANRPFAEGAVLRRLRGRPLPEWAAEIDARSWPELLLKWVVAHPAITCAIPATSNVAHLRENMRAASGALPDESLRARIAAELR
jgi:diketogulonate reductase-like aldo/keto reductase